LREPCRPKAAGGLELVGLARAMAGSTFRREKRGDEGQSDAHREYPMLIRMTATVFAAAVAVRALTSSHWPIRIVGMSFDISLHLLDKHTVR
jgi:hypothetical protein